MKRTIAIVTGTRAEYGLFVPILREIQRSKDLDYALYVTGMHLSGEFGETVRQIKEDGFRILKTIDVLNKDDKGSGMGAYIGEFTAALARDFERKRPDVLLVLGDRGEMLAGAIAATCMNIPVAHIHGGEVSGSVDDGFRHAITKLAHIHLCATEGSAERIKKMGEDSKRIFVVGAPGLDNTDMGRIEPRIIAKKYNLNLNKPIALVVQHPVVQECGNAAWQMEETLEAVVELGLQAIIIFPNADPGGREMIKVIKSYEKRYPRIRSFKSLKRLEYLTLMKMASVMIGNSSSGIIETPNFKLPVVNVGGRQKRRERACNVINVKYGRNNVARGVNKVLHDKTFRDKLMNCKNLYGQEKTSEKIVRILRRLKIDKKLLSKQMRY